MKSPYLLTLMVAASALAGCKTTNPGVSQTNSIPTHISDILSPGDELRITFSGAPDLSQIQKIRPDGKISLPKVGEIQAAGKSPSSLQAQLVTLYKPSLQNAEITVIVDNSTFPVIVLGAVNHPSEVNLDRPSLLDAIGKAGGIARGLGDASRIRIIHEGDKASTARVVNLEAILKGRSTGIIYLQRGDTIIVPEKWF